MANESQKDREAVYKSKSRHLAKTNLAKYAGKMKLDKPSKGNADKSPRTAKADY